MQVAKAEKAQKAAEAQLAAATSTSSQAELAKQHEDRAVEIFTLQVTMPPRTPVWRALSDQPMHSFGSMAACRDLLCTISAADWDRCVIGSELPAPSLNRLLQTTSEWLALCWCARQSNECAPRDKRSYGAEATQQRGS